ncbi:MAG TPA: cupredoxin domain-containing protein [Candidatus Eremiobacteraceae bacterium]|nr:cupredoxin domain-containing protein [Candidatus Eremiobacteraceae bacterium]
MRTSLNRIGIGLAVAAVLAAAVSLMPATSSAHPSIDIAVANWKFTPDKITIPVGEPTTLRMTTTSGVHGIKSDELGIPMTTIPNGKVIEVTFTPAKAGTYVLHCQIFCGPGHPNMALTIVVTP